MADEEPVSSETFEDSNGSGPGFLLGVFVGAIAGAAAAKLFAPSRDELADDFSREISSVAHTAEVNTDELVDRTKSIVERVRGRIQDASAEAREAAREAEEHGRERFRELTESDS